MDNEQLTRRHLLDCSFLDCICTLYSSSSSEAAEAAAAAAAAAAAEVAAWEPQL